MGTRGVVYGLAVTLLLGMAVVLTAGAAELRSVHQSPAAHCDRTTPLVPRSRGGLPWQQHRHWLEPLDGDRLPGQSHLVRNDRTGEWFRWNRTAGGQGDPRFMTPTRYVLLRNRQWHDDPWTYCLVLAPQPPFQFSKGGFVTSARAQPATLEAGTPALITVEVTAGKATTAQIAVEIRGERGEQVHQWMFDQRALGAGQSVSYDMLWQSPEGLDPGVYLVEVGVFSPVWANLSHWNDGTGILLVRGVERFTEP